MLFDFTKAFTLLLRWTPLHVVTLTIRNHVLNL